MARRTIPGAKVFLARLPVEIHDALRREAEAVAAAEGGHANMNRALVSRLIQSCALADAQLKSANAFLNRM